MIEPATQTIREANHAPVEDSATVTKPRKKSRKSEASRGNGEDDLVRIHDTINDAVGKGKALLILVTDQGNQTDQTGFTGDHDSIVTALYVVMDMLHAIDEANQRLGQVGKRIGGRS